MYTFILTIHIIVCLLLILIVLVQVGRGAEMGAAFGGVGQANYIQTPENFLGKITTYLAIAFMVLSLSLALLSGKTSSSSVIENTDLKAIQEEITPVATPQDNTDSAPTENSQ